MKSLDIKSVIIGVMGATIIFLVTGAKKNYDHLRVQRLDLVNEAGEICAVLNSLEDGGAIFSLGSLQKGSKFDESFTVLVDRGEDAQGGSVYLSLGGKRGNMRLTNDYGGAGPLIYMMNSKGKISLSAGIWGETDKGYVRIDEHDPEKEGVSGKMHPMHKLDGMSFMVVGDEGEVLWGAPQDAE